MPCGVYIPRKWRMPQLILGLLILELPFTVANLALFGIASPNLYRDKLWKYGGERGWNSDPSTVLYAYANYRPVKTPVVWSSFQTRFNLVVGVLTMFFYLIKFTIYILHAFWPSIAFPIHIGLTAIWAYSIYTQTAPDTIDPKRKNSGAPWYITKNCNVVKMTDDTSFTQGDLNDLKGYCMQAKSAFAVSVLMLYVHTIFPSIFPSNTLNPNHIHPLPLITTQLTPHSSIFVFWLIISIISMIPSKEGRLAYATKRAEKRAEKEKFDKLANSPYSSPYDNEMTADEQWQHMWELQQLPRTPGTAGGMKSPLTPRTRAFGALEGGYYGGQQQVPMPQSYYTQQAQGQQIQTQMAGMRGGGTGPSPIAEQDEWVGGSSIDTPTNEKGKTVAY
ncbi:hypothetical protein P154DRAFT_580534 [Amniculicola lignicola CBS 123094]|uniref:Uncharacterized protein n=1 Tax=Amniculicola lignicola CBS 123094 TaxID=1392246 RepID=A0A6A5W274_9PLEO|nr:hypothetical protein P154DRAFT_580534 [Amniculicola lignicola CBS 123094]